MKVLVTGSRFWSNAAVIERELAKLPQGTIIVHGACPNGADMLADKAAMKLGLKIRRYPADWSEGKKAGPLRNAKMIREEHKSGEPIDLGLAFTEDLERSRGTKDTVTRARSAGIKVLVFKE